MEIVVGASVAFIGFSLAWSDWFELLPGRYTGRLLGLALVASMFTAFRYDPEAAMKPFLAASQGVVDYLTEIANDVITSPSTTVPVPSTDVTTTVVVAP